MIYDLKEVNTKDLVSVKLVSEPGVGTIASGVAKAYADLITISGHDGGTGASPLTSIRYAGSPWELGLAEAHQSLRDSGLRHKVRLQADGGMKTGLDVIKAAILGAESFGFGTGPMIAMGCKYLRICHLNNCATGVATQRDDLIKHHFVGEKQKVINYFEFIANDVRNYLSILGVKTLEDLIGQTQYLEKLNTLDPQYKSIDLSGLLHKDPVASRALARARAPRLARAPPPTTTTPSARTSSPPSTSTVSRRRERPPRRSPTSSPCPPSASSWTRCQGRDTARRWRRN